MITFLTTLILASLRKNPFLLALRRWGVSHGGTCSSARKVPSGEEQGETDVFAGYILACYHDVGIAGTANSLRKLAPCREIWSPESEKFLLVDTRILGFGTRKTAQGIRNPTDDRIWYPSPTESGIQYLGIQNPWHGIQNPRLSWVPLHGARKQSFGVVLRYEGQ